MNLRWAGGSPAVVDGGVAAVGGDAGAGKPAVKKRPGRRPGGRPVSEDGGGEEIVLTAGDRALEWRGEDVTLPPARIDMGAGGGEARKLDDGEINGVIAGQSEGVRECVAKLATGTDLAATITVQLVVDGGGRVTRSRVQAPRYLVGKGLHECVQRAARQMRFPATGAPTLVVFPVHLG